MHACPQMPSNVDRQIWTCTRICISITAVPLVVRSQTITHTPNWELHITSHTTHTHTNTHNIRIIHSVGQYYTHISSHVHKSFARCRYTLHTRIDFSPKCAPPYGVWSGHVGHTRTTTTTATNTHVHTHPFAHTHIHGH